VLPCGARPRRSTPSCPGNSISGSEELVLSAQRELLGDILGSREELAHPEPRAERARLSARTAGRFAVVDLAVPMHAGTGNRRPSNIATPE